MKRAQYRYMVDFKLRGSKTTGSFLTGYVPAGLKMSELQKYIQGRAVDKIIVNLTLMTPRCYYPEVDEIGPNGEIDVNDDELFTAQSNIQKEVDSGEQELESKSESQEV